LIQPKKAEENLWAAVVELLGSLAMLDFDQVG
jgi:hypothetical protein